MVTKNITETPVSHTLTNGDSVTVPSGEVWRVSIHMTGGSPSNQVYAEAVVQINDVSVATAAGNDADGQANEARTEQGVEETVLVGGDTVSVNADHTDIGAHISGFKVGNTVDNTPVSEQLSDGQSVSPASGEVWRVSIIAGELDWSSTSHNSVTVEVNGVAVISGGGNEFAGQGNEAHACHAAEQMVFTDTDTIAVSTYSSGDNGAHIGGFVVN